jgi:hypothetical protein
VGDCTTAPPYALSERPSYIIFTCADAGLGVQHMAWSAWTSTTATGQGSLWLNLCKPNCAEGKYGHYPVRVTLTDVKSSRQGPWFSDLTIAYEGARPPYKLPLSYSMMPPQG